MINWSHDIEQKWKALRFGEVKVETDGEQHVFEVQMYLDDLDPEAVLVELYANGIKDVAPEACGNEACAATGGCNKRLRLSRRGACNTPRIGLYGTPHSTPQ